MVKSKRSVKTCRGRVRTTQAGIVEWGKESTRAQRGGRADQLDAGFGHRRLDRPFQQLPATAARKSQTLKCTVNSRHRTLFDQVDPLSPSDSIRAL